MALGKSNKLGWRDIADIPFIDDPIGQLASGDQTPQPFRRDGIVFIVIGCHAATQTFADRPESFLRRVPLSLILPSRSNSVTRGRTDRTVSPIHAAI